MKKLKLILTLCIVVCVAAIACLFTACNNEDEKATSVTVTVKLPDGNPATGVKVGICEISEGGKCLNPVAVDATGKAVIDLTGDNKLEGDTMEIHLYVLPEGYVYADEDGNPYETDTLKEGKHGKQIPMTQDNVTITLKAAN